MTNGTNTLKQALKRTYKDLKKYAKDNGGKIDKIKLSNDEELEIVNKEVKLNNASKEKPGLMSNTDKDKLDKLENYTLPKATKENLGGIKLNYAEPGGGIKRYALKTDENGNAYTEVPWNDTKYNPATESADGLLSKEDKAKINKLPQEIENIVVDEDYVHTDENFSTELYNKLKNIPSNLALKSDISTAISNIVVATESEKGFMSAEDKKRLNTLVAMILDNEEDSDDFVNTISEILAVFNNYPEGQEILLVLANKVDKIEGKTLVKDFTNYPNTYVEDGKIKTESGVESDIDDPLVSLIDKSVDRKVNKQDGKDIVKLYDDLEYPIISENGLKHLTKIKIQIIKSNIQKCSNDYISNGASSNYYKTLDGRPIIYYYKIFITQWGLWNEYYPHKTVTYKGLRFSLGDTRYQQYCCINFVDEYVNPETGQWRYKYKLEDGTTEDLPIDSAYLTRLEDAIRLLPGIFELEVGEIFTTQNITDDTRMDVIANSFDSMGISIDYNDINDNNVVANFDGNIYIEKRFFNIAYSGIKTFEPSSAIQGVNVFFNSNLVERDTGIPASVYIDLGWSSHYTNIAKYSENFKKINPLVRGTSNATFTVSPIKGDDTKIAINLSGIYYEDGEYKYNNNGSVLNVESSIYTNLLIEKIRELDENSYSYKEANSGTSYNAMARLELSFFVDVPREEYVDRYEEWGFGKVLFNTFANKQDDLGRLVEDGYSLDYYDVLEDGSIRPYGVKAKVEDYLLGNDVSYISGKNYFTYTGKPIVFLIDMGMGFVPDSRLPDEDYVWSNGIVEITRCPIDDYKNVYLCINFVNEYKDNWGNWRFYADFNGVHHESSFDGDYLAAMKDYIATKPEYSHPDKALRNTYIRTCKPGFKPKGIVKDIIDLCGLKETIKDIEKAESEVYGDD